MLKQTIIYLGLGSNMGQPRKNLQQAVKLLSEQVNILSVSPLYDTAPLGNKNQPRFLNAVCKGKTSLKPEALLRFVKSIEKEMGRTPTPRNSPRPIDIDIIFYGHSIMTSDELTIPHPRATERAFVLVPLADISPGFRHPVFHRTVRTLLLQLQRTKSDAVRA
jgi:2-amino-4-hydroxy-6-hydroxymethyldihydropteridine diphosphokinase